MLGKKKWINWKTMGRWRLGLRILVPKAGFLSYRREKFFFSSCVFLFYSLFRLRLFRLLLRQGYVRKKWCTGTISFVPNTFFEGGRIFPSELFNYHPWLEIRTKSSSRGFEVLFGGKEHGAFTRDYVEIARITRFKRVDTDSHGFGNIPSVR